MPEGRVARWHKQTYRTPSKFKFQIDNKSFLNINMPHVKFRTYLHFKNICYLKLNGTVYILSGSPAKGAVTQSDEQR